ncbi:MAG: peptidoglycan-binding protein [Chthoniobacterales bacterium]
MILRIGSNGSAVAQLQLNLNQLAENGNFTLPEGPLKGTGTFGEKTEETVQAFQKKFGLKADGVVGPETFAKMDSLKGWSADASPIGRTKGRKAPKKAKTPKTKKAARAAKEVTDARAEITQKLIEIAQHEVGVREVGGNNCGVRVRDYQRATELRPLGPWPWCAAFTDWVIREWINNFPEVRRALGWRNEELEAKRPKTASAFEYLDWARRFEQEILPPTATPEPGMIAIFEFSHICFVKAPIDAQTFQTIEGNTNGRGDRDSVTGDGVWEKTRPRNLLRNFIRWHFVTAPGAGTFISDAQPPAKLLPNTQGIGGIPREAIEFIIDEEGMDQPWRFPGGDSGVTLGHGYDLGAGTESNAEMVNDWKAWLNGAQLDRLGIAIGKTGETADALCPQFRDINVTVEAADDVFFRATVPKYYNKMLSAFPNVNKLPGSAQGALLSLVFNRGTSLKGDRRREMSEIKDLLAGEPPYDLAAIAKELREMKRLWEGKGLDGLIARREREARLVESCIVPC